MNRKIIICSLVLGLLPITAVPAQAGCSNNVGSCSIKYPAKGSKYKKLCNGGCYKGHNSNKGNWLP